MYIFRKYEFPSEELYNSLVEKYIGNPYHTFVALGIIRDNKFSVDVLWYGGSDSEWIEYEIYDIEGNGTHTFSGFDFNREQDNLNI
jgi:hypothetical protein